MSNLPPPPNVDNKLGLFKWLYLLYERLIRSLSFQYKSITSAYTTTSSDEFIEITSGTFTLTLITAVGYKHQLTIINSGAGTITLATTSSQTISGNASGVLTLSRWDSITLRSNNANWLIV